MRIRVASMQAKLIEKGDTLVKVPWIDMGQRTDQATVIGIVTEVRDMSWMVRNDAGEIFEHPSEGPNVLTYIHVPSPSA